MANWIGAYPWVSSRAIDMDAIDVSFSGTPSKTTRRHRCCWTPWNGGQVSTSSQKEEWHTLVCRRTPCRQLPRRWTGSDTRFQRLPHQLQHMQGHQLPRSRDLRSDVKHLSHLFRKSGTHLRLLLLLPLLLPLQACWRREERSLQNSETMPTVATLSFPPRQANDCDRSSASCNNYSPIPTQKFTFCFPPSISLSPFSKPTPNSKVECQRTHSTLDIKHKAKYKVHLCDKGIGIIRISHYGCNGRWTSISSSLFSTLLDLIWSKHEHKLPTTH